jgi:metallo-beta-lactamase family protein
LLVKSGFTGPVYTQHASRDLCRIMLKDAGYLNEKNAEWENKKRQRKGLKPITPLYTMEDAQIAQHQIKGVPYDNWKKILPGVKVRFHDAGHILGASIVELILSEGGEHRRLVFSGDLGKWGAPILRDPTLLRDADIVLLESTYGDRLHRSFEETLRELQDIIAMGRQSEGNILIPAFAVGRSQELLYLFAKNYRQWHLEQWQVFLDSPMAIEATQVYMRHKELYDAEASRLYDKNRQKALLPNLSLTRTANQSMKLNVFQSGAIIIAGSGMCNGGRIRHHLKHNVWRDNCHVVIVGFQARGTLGRQLVDGARRIRLWGETIRVAAQVHTVGGLSAHGDQQDLIRWYKHFSPSPALFLVHGEPDSINGLARQIKQQVNVDAHIPRLGQQVDLLRYPRLVGIKNHLTKEASHVKRRGNTR